MKKLKFALASLLIFTVVMYAQSATIRVPQDFQTIQSAINAAMNGDTIIVAKGTYKGTGNKDLDFKGKAITLQSESGPLETIIDCQGSGRGFYFHSGETANSVVNGFTIKNGAPGANLVKIAINAQTGEKMISTNVLKDVNRPQNDGDIAVEPGEVMGLEIAISNNSPNPFNNVTAILRTSDTRVSGLIPIYSGSVITGFNNVNLATAEVPMNYGYLLGNTIKSASFQFVKINNDFKPLGSTVRFTLEIRSDNFSIGSDEFDVRVGADIIMDRVDVDSGLKPGGEPQEIDFRIKNITTKTLEKIRVLVNADAREVNILTRRVEFESIRSGRTEIASFLTEIDPGFAGYVHFTISIEVDRTLVNNASYTHYFGMRSHYINHWILNDNNRNGIAEPGETIWLQIERWNPTDQLVRDVLTDLSTSDNRIAKITEYRGDYRDIPANEVKESRREYEFTIADAADFGNVPNFDKLGYTVEFTLSVEEDREDMGKETFPFRIGGSIRYLPPDGFNDLMANISDRKNLDPNNNGNGMPEPGEVIEMQVTLINISENDIDSVEAELDSDDDIRILDDYGEFGTIRRRNRTGTDKFLFRIDDDFEGNKITFELSIEGKINNRRESLGMDVFTIPVKTKSQSNESSSISEDIASTPLPLISGFGGGISCINGSSPTIKYNIIIKNSSIGLGGGIFCSDNSAPLIINNVIAGNTAATYGGGIGCINNATPVVINNTISGNTAVNGGGGISCQGSSFATVLNTILWGNSIGQIYTEGSYIDITYSNIQGSWPGTGNINADPLFVNASLDDYHLMNNSPCINTGITAPNVPDKDIEKNPRPNPPGSRPDMGAYENSMPFSSLSVTSVTPSVAIQGATNLEISVNGMNFVNGANVFFSGTGITVTSITFVSSTKINVKINVAQNAPIGARNVTVTNPGGQTATGNNMLQVSSTTASVLKINVAQTVGKGVDFPAEIRIENITNLAGYQMEIQFNPNILEAIKVDEGTFLKTGANTYWQDPIINNTAGIITKIASARLGAGGVSGTGLLATVTFRGKNNGESIIKILNQELYDPNGPLTVTTVDSKVNVGSTPAWDVNKDGKVDVFDLVLVGQRFGEIITTPVSPNPDVNGDGKVDVFDLVLVGQHFGEIYTATAPSANIWKVDPGYLPILIKMYNIMEDNPSSDPEFAKTKALLNSLITKTRVDKTEVFQNYPNPFNPETWIPFKLSDGAEVEVRIYSSTGNLIRVLDLGYKNPGYYTSKSDSIYWDGTDGNGEKVSSGVYFYAIRAGQYSATRKMLLVK